VRQFDYCSLQALCACRPGGQIRNNEMGGACGTSETADTYRDLVGKPEGKQLVRQRHRWEENIKMNLQESRWEHGLDLSGSG
jgi:hypothetical protein